MPRRTDLNEELRERKERLEAEADRLNREILTAPATFAARLQLLALRPGHGAW